MGTFTLYPAIDLRGGEVVRLEQGDFTRQKVYSANPIEVAERFWAAGADWLHLVNLDGALGESAAANRGVIRLLLEWGAQNCPQKKVQVGGGLRSLDSIRTVLGWGAQRVILGTAAVENPRLVEEALAQFGAERIAAGIDVWDGKVRLRGWLSTSQASPAELGLRLAQMGLITAIFTNIAQDGMGAGLDLPASRALMERTGLQVIGSGGVNSLADLRGAKEAGLAGVVVGKALYEGKFTLQEALRC